MNKLIIKVGASDNHFGAYTENADGVYGAGNTPQEAINNALEGLKLLKETRPKENLSPILQKDYEIEYQYDTESFLKYYTNIFSKPALEKLTGINQKQLHHYASGISKPREAQKKKIETALHSLGRELLAVKL